MPRAHREITHLLRNMSWRAQFNYLLPPARAASSCIFCPASGRPRAWVMKTNGERVCPTRLPPRVEFIITRTQVLRFQFPALPRRGVIRRDRSRIEQHRSASGVVYKAECRPGRWLWTKSFQSPHDTHHFRHYITCSYSLNENASSYDWRWLEKSMSPNWLKTRALYFIQIMFVKDILQLNLKLDKVICIYTLKEIFLLSVFLC